MEKLMIWGVAGLALIVMFFLAVTALMIIDIKPVESTTVVRLNPTSAPVQLPTAAPTAEPTSVPAQIVADTPVALDAPSLSESIAALQPTETATPTPEPTTDMSTFRRDPIVQTSTPTPWPRRKDVEPVRVEVPSVGGDQPQGSGTDCGAFVRDLEDKYGGYGAVTNRDTNYITDYLADISDWLKIQDKSCQTCAAEVSNWLSKKGVPYSAPGICKIIWTRDQ